MRTQTLGLVSDICSTTVSYKQLHSILRWGVSYDGRTLHPAILSFSGTGGHSQKCKGSENIPHVEKLFEHTFQWFIGFGIM